MDQHLVVLHIGSNIGDRLHKLQLCNSKLEEIFGPSVASSGVYETAAWGKENQADFLNAALCFHSSIDTEVLFPKILELENDMGRTRKEHWGPRIIDVDIIFHGSRIISQPDLTIPHPRAHLRNFVLAPLLDIIPYFRHPQLKRTIEELYLSCKDPLKVQLTDINL